MNDKGMEKKKSVSLRLELAEKFATLVTAGFGLVAALAWNDAIQALFNRFFPAQSGIVAKFLYAALITAIVVIVTTRLARIADRLKKE